VLDLNVVEPEWNAAGGEASGRVGGIVTVELSGVAGECDGAFDAEAGRVGDFEAELSTIALRQERNRAQDKNQQGLEKCSHGMSIVGGALC